MSFFGKMGRYGMSRLQPESVRNVSREAVQSGGSRALEALRPEHLDIQDIRGGIRGRYADGGRARFSEMAREQGLSLSDLDAIELHHGRMSSLFFILAAAFLCAAAGMILLGGGGISLGGAVVLLLFSLGSMASAIRSDFSAWSVRLRAFPGFRRYLATRFFSG